MDGFILWTGDIIQAADDRTLAFVKKHQGEVMSVTIHTGKGARDLVRHNQFYAILDRAVDSMDYEIHSNADREVAVEDLLIKLKYAVGFTDMIKDLDGVSRTIPRSIAFDICSETDADTFRKGAYAMLCTILKCSRQELFGI